MSDCSHPLVRRGACTACGELVRFAPRKQGSRPRLCVICSKDETPDNPLTPGEDGLLECRRCCTEQLTVRRGPEVDREPGGFVSFDDVDAAIKRLKIPGDKFEDPTPRVRAFTSDDGKGLDATGEAPHTVARRPGAELYRVAKRPGGKPRDRAAAEAYARQRHWYEGAEFLGSDDRYWVWQERQR